MKSAEFEKLQPGLYRLEFPDGKVLAAVGRDGDGKRWYHPCNWLSGPCYSWTGVQSVEPIEIWQPPEPKKPDTDREVLAGLVKIGERFRNTPIVDDDFCAIKNEFDSALERAARHLDKPQPPAAPYINVKANQDIRIERPGADGAITLSGKDWLDLWDKWRGQ